MKKILLALTLSLGLFSNAQNIGLDATFGTNGITRVAQGNYFDSLMKFQSDGKIIITTYSSSTATNYIYRLNTNGSIDTSFGTNGYVEFPGIDNEIEVLNILPNDKIVFGIFTPEYIVRLNADGSYDTTFGTDGALSLNSQLNTTVNEIRSILVNTDNSLYVTGYNYITKVTENGNIDTTYGTNGLVSTTLGYNTVFSNDNKILTVVTNGIPNYKLIKKNLDGTTDMTFGTNGEIDIIDVNSNDNGFQLYNDNDGKIIVVATRQNALRITRYLPNGQKDITFGTNGDILNTSTPPTIVNYIPNGNKLVFCGATNTYQPTFDLYICQYNNDGTFDTTFNTTGFYVEQNITNNEAAGKILLKNDGNFIVTGTNLNNTPDNFTARYSPVTLSTTDFHLNKSISFENPVTEKLMITSKEEIKKIELYSLEGKFIKLDNSNTIDTSSLLNGIYIMKVVFTNGDVLSEKIIKK